jgi:hypothetical protein
MLELLEFPKPATPRALLGVVTAVYVVIGGIFAGGSPGISGPIAEAEVGSDGSRGRCVMKGRQQRKAHWGSEKEGQTKICAAEETRTRGKLEE